MKRTYLKPTTERLTTQTEGLLASLSLRFIGNKATGTAVDKQPQDMLGKGTLIDAPNGEWANGKFHHTWNLWDDEEE